MNAWNRFWYAPVHPLRRTLLMRGLYGMLAFDCWVNFIGHAGRYGIGGFNVAHFEWLDAIQPTPGPGIYIAFILSAGLLAFVGAFYRPSPWLSFAVFGTYTYAWAMSMLDSYQHHYLLSLILLSVACMTLRPFRSTDPEKHTDSAPYVMVGVTSAIVYFFTAVTKLGADWRTGEALSRLVPDALATSVLSPFHRFGIESPEAWTWIARSAIAVQLISSIGYLVATQQDRHRRSGWMALLFLAPLSFHIGAEKLTLAIGWFSYYMIWIAIVFFTPTLILEKLDRLLPSHPSFFKALERGVNNRPKPERRLLALAFFALLAIALAWCAHSLDLPGATATVVATGLWIGAVATRTRDAAKAGSLAMVAILATVALTATVSFTNGRFDYYRYAAGDHRRRGDYETALYLYQQTNRYAPEGRDRKEREEEMRRKLGR